MKRPALGGVISAATITAFTAFSTLPAYSDIESLNKIDVLPIFERSSKEALYNVIDTSASDREVAVAWHGLAGAGIEGASARAVELFYDLSEADPSQPVLKAYLGSAYIMKARDASFIGTRIRNVRLGLRSLEAAIEAAPDDFRVRTLRAVTAYNLPDIFDYRGEVSKDLEAMLALIGRNEAAPETGTDIHGRVLAAVAKERLLEGNVPGAVSLIEQLETQFSGVPELIATAALLRQETTN